MRLFRCARLAANVTGVIAMTLVTAACGGGGGSGGNSGPITATPSPTPSPTPTSSVSCSLSARQDWAKAVLEEWYLFPDLLDTSVNKANYNTLQDYIDAMTAPARAASKDRYFTYLTSIEDEDAYYTSGTTAGFGMLLTLYPDGLYLREAYETAPAFKAGMDRGTQIVSIGYSSSSMTNVTDMSYDQLVSILTPSGVGDSRVFRFDPDGPSGSASARNATVAAAEFDIEPLSPRYGGKVLNFGTAKIGYVNLRTFIQPAEGQLRTAFADFKSQGIDKVVVDVRYNGGGSVYTANVFSSLMNADHVGDLFTRLELRDSKSEYNEDYPILDESSAIQTSRVAFIGTHGSASASELIMNSQIPFTGDGTALIGENTYGKPVGQYAFDLTECDDRLRVITFRTVNSLGTADYYTGMASVMPLTCRADDDVSNQLGSTTEESIATSLQFLTGVITSNSSTCLPLSSSTKTTQAYSRKITPKPAHPNPAQIEMPGLF